MKKCLGCILIGVVCGCAVGCGRGQEPAEPESPEPPAVKETAATAPPQPTMPVLIGNPEAGAEVYGRICVACHQADGRGLGGVLAADFVGDKSRLAKPDAVLLNSIRNGLTVNGRVMPAQKGVLTEQEMADALSYVRKSFGGE